MQRLPGLELAAQRRGVPLVYAQMDEQDAAVISPASVVAEDYARLYEASRRYDPQHILLIRIESREGLWYALWSFVAEGRAPQRWRSLGDEPNAALASGFDKYADELANRYSTKVAAAGWVQDARLRVVGVKDLTAYARVMAYLDRSNLIESASPRELINDEVAFSVKFEGDMADLRRNLSLGGFMTEEAAPAIGTMIAAQPAYGSLGGTSVGETSVSNTGTSPAAAAPSGLSFYAVAQQQELRFRYNGY